MCCPNARFRRWAGWSRFRIPRATSFASNNQPQRSQSRLDNSLPHPSLRAMSHFGRPRRCFEGDGSRRRLSSHCPSSNVLLAPGRILLEPVGIRPVRTTIRSFQLTTNRDRNQLADRGLSPLRLISFLSAFPLHSVAAGRISHRQERHRVFLHYGLAGGVVSGLFGVFACA